MNARLKTTSAAVIAISIVALGCGSSGSSTSSSGAASTGGDSSSLSKAEFVEQANAACQQAKKGAFARVAFYAKVHRSDGLPQKVLAERAFNRAFVFAVEKEVDALEELLPAAGKEKKFEVMLVSKEAALRAATRIELQAEEIRELDDLFTESNKRARSLGLAHCVASA